MTINSLPPPATIHATGGRGNTVIAWATAAAVITPGGTALTTAANQLIYATGADTFAMTALTAFGRSLIDDADAAARIYELKGRPPTKPAAVMFFDLAPAKSPRGSRRQ